MDVGVAEKSCRSFCVFFWIGAQGKDLVILERRCLNTGLFVWPPSLLSLLALLPSLALLLLLSLPP